MMSIVAQVSNVAYGLLVNRWEWRIRGLQSNPFLNKNITTNCEKYIWLFSVRQSGKFNNGFIFIICWFNFVGYYKNNICDHYKLNVKIKSQLIRRTCVWIQQWFCYYEMWLIFESWCFLKKKKRRRYVFLPLSNLIMQEFDICMTYNSLGLYA